MAQVKCKQGTVKYQRRKLHLDGSNGYFSKNI